MPEFELTDTNNKTGNNNWKPTDNRFVAFFDILGFKDMIMRKSHQDIYNILQDISQYAKDVEDDWLDEINNHRTGCHVVIFSDSIVLFSKDDTFENFEKFIFDTANLFRKILQAGVMLKGAVAHGKISINKSSRIFFGQPIIDAYHLEEDLNYLGIVCHSTFDEYIDKLDSDIKEDVYFKLRIKRFMTPLKSGMVTHNNISWLMRRRADSKNMSATDIIYNLYPQVSGSPRRYLDKTLDVLPSMGLKKK